MRERVPFLPVDRWIAASGRRTAIAVLVGVFVLAGGLVWWRQWDATVADRIAHGRPVAATVSGVDRVFAGRGRAPRVAVAYTVDGVARSARLMAITATGRYAAGDRVTLYVDPADPAKVTTRDGFASEGYLSQGPVITVAVGAGLLLVLLVARVAHAMRVRRERRAGIRHH
jgi:hypothetical protein